MLDYPRHNLVAKRVQFSIRNVWQSRADVNDDALRKEFRIVVIEVREFVGGTRHDLSVERASADR